MVLATDQTVFSIPLRYLWTSDHNGYLEILDQPSSGLNRFVGDQSNHLLKVLAEDRIKNFFSVEGPAFCWPLVFYGPSGTGKTSLALALISDLVSQISSEEHSLKARHPAGEKDNISSLIRPVLLSASDFDRRFRSAISTDSVSDYRQKIIKSKGLFLDNLQHLRDKIGAQQELLQVIDQMLAENYPVVITVDQDPLAGNLFIPQLASRLSSGLCLPVQQPGAAAREVIIRDLCQVHKMTMTEEAIRLLVERLNVSVPRILHFFGRLKMAQPAISDSVNHHSVPPIDEHFIQAAFELSEEDRHRLSAIVIKTVAVELKVSAKDLASDSRKQSIVFGRSLAIYLIRTLIGSSFTKIGVLMGNRDHTTILHSYRKISSIMEQPEPTSHKLLIEKLQRQLTNLFSLETTLLH